MPALLAAIEPEAALVTEPPDSRSTPMLNVPVAETVPELTTVPVALVTYTPSLPPMIEAEAALVTEPPLSNSTP